MVSVTADGVQDGHTRTKHERVGSWLTRLPQRRADFSICSWCPIRFLLCSIRPGNRVVAHRSNAAAEEGGFPGIANLIDAVIVDEWLNALLKVPVPITPILHCETNDVIELMD